MRVGDKVHVQDVPERAAYLVINGDLTQVELLALDVPREDLVAPTYQQQLDVLAAEYARTSGGRSALAAYRCS